MPFLSVIVDGTAVATVDTKNRDIVTVRVGGSRDDDDFADLSVTGGIYDCDGTTEHRIWVDRMQLAAGQTVSVAFLAQANPFGEGKTIEELYPDLDESRLPSAVDRAELAAEIRQLPLVRDGFSLRLVSSDGTASTHATGPDEHGFGFNIMWNYRHPDRVAMSLTAYTIDSVAEEAPGRTLADRKIPLQGEIRLELVA